MFLLRVAAAAKSPQSCLTLCDPIDGSPPGSQGFSSKNTVLSCHFLLQRISGAQLADHHLTSKKQYLKAISLQQLITPFLHISYIWSLLKALREFVIFFPAFGLGLHYFLIQAFKIVSPYRHAYHEFWHAVFLLSLC